MKISKCGIVRDLLPLYIEDAISEETKKFVDEHLKICGDCKNELKLSQIDIPIKTDTVEVDRGIEVIKKIGSDIRKKRVFTGVVSAFLSAIVVILLFAYSTEPEYLPYTDSSELFSLKDNNGIVTLSFEGNYEIYQNEQGVYYFSIYNTFWNQVFNVSKKQDITVNPNGEAIKTIFYVSNDGQQMDQVIYGINPFENGYAISLPRLVLNYYFATAILLALVLIVTFLLLRKNQRLKRVILKIFGIPLSYIFSHILIKGLNATSYSAARDFYLILLLAIPIYFLLSLIFDSKNGKVAMGKKLKRESTK